MTIHRTMMPAMANAADMVFVTAAVVLKMADMVNIDMKLKRKKMKNCDGSARNPARKYRMMLKQVVTQNLMGRSATIPATASVKG